MSAGAGATPRLTITGGGEPDADRLAALVVALSTVRAHAADEPAAGAWRRAALLEGVGGATVLTPGDLDVVARNRGG